MTNINELLRSSFIFFKSLNAMNRFRVGQAFELVGMDTLEQLSLLPKLDDDGNKHKLDYHQLAKLELRQRKYSAR